MIKEIIHDVHFYHKNQRRQLQLTSKQFET